MLDSIFIGMTGLISYSRGLRVIANNTANINTPGFKGSSVQFGDLFYANGTAGGALNGSGVNQLGQGVTTYANTLDFSQGELRQSGNGLDLAVDGQGLFTLKDKEGNLSYTRDGQFTFDDEGFLVSKSSGAKVMGYDANGALVEVTIDGVRFNDPKATTTVKFMNSLTYSTSATSLGSHTLTDVTVLDTAGAEHILTVEFKQVEAPVGAQVRWKVTVKDGTTEVGGGTLVFNGSTIDPASAKITVNYTPTGMTQFPLVLDFSGDVRTWPGTDSVPDTLKVSSTDGYEAGSLTEATFDADGVLNLKYSNGETAKGVTLALARFNSTESVRSAGDNMFEPTAVTAWETGAAGTGAFGAIRSGVVEISNVNLSSEFSDLVIMQRGYQASSQVVSTANEMLQELFSLKGR
jgi:flagellar hook protein FlgE